LGSKNTFIIFAKYYMIDCSSSMLLTHAVQPDASEVISEACFYVATHFLTEIWDRRWCGFSLLFVTRYYSLLRRSVFVTWYSLP